MYQNPNEKPFFFMKKKQKVRPMTLKATDWLKGGPKVVYNDNDFFSAHPGLNDLKKDYLYARVHHDLRLGGRRASYMGGGGDLVQEWYDELTGTLKKRSATSGPITWSCHDKLKDLTLCGEVITLWERGARDINSICAEFIYDIHFNEELPFHKILTDSVILCDKGKKRVRATAFLNYNKRPQRLCAMFYIACRQGLKNNSWASHYFLGKLAGFTPAEAFMLSGASWSGPLGITDSTFESDSTREEDWLKVVKKKIDSCFNSGLSLDTGDGPMGVYGNTLRNAVNYPSFLEFSKGIFDEDSLNKVKWSYPQPSNNVFKLNDIQLNLKSNIAGSNFKSWWPDYGKALRSVVLGNLNAASKSVAVVRKVLSEKGSMFYVKGD